MNVVFIFTKLQIEIKIFFFLEITFLCLALAGHFEALVPIVLTADDQLLDIESHWHKS